MRIRLTTRRRRQHDLVARIQEKLDEVMRANLADLDEHHRTRTPGPFLAPVLEAALDDIADRVRAETTRGLTSVRRHSSHESTVTVDIRADTTAVREALNRATEAMRRLRMAMWDRPPVSPERLWIRAYGADQHEAAHAWLTDLLEQTYTDLGLPFVPANITLGEN